MNQASSALLTTIVVAIVMAAVLAAQLAREGRLNRRHLPMLALIVFVPSAIALVFAVQTSIGPGVLGLVLLVLGGFLFTNDRAAHPVEPHTTRRIALLFVASGLFVVVGGAVSALFR